MAELRRRLSACVVVCSRNTASNAGSADFSVLLARRSPTSRFMPNAYVFPGGRVDGADERADGGLGETLACVPHVTRAQNRMLKRAAARELYEEVGILCGIADPGVLKKMPSRSAVRANPRLFDECHTAYDRLTFVCSFLTPDFETARQNAKGIGKLRVENVHPF